MSGRRYDAGQRDRGDDGDWQFVRGVALCALWPMVAAWRLVPVLSERPAVWRRSGLRGWRLAATCVGVFLVAAVVAWHALWLTSPDLSWQLLVTVLGGWWLLQVPLAIVLVVLALGFEAAKLAVGRIQPHRADLLRQAIETAADQDASQQLKRHRKKKTDDQVLGAVMDVERRDVITRLRDRRHTGASPWQRGNLVVLPTEPQRLILVAGSGHGKTTLIRAQARAALERGWRVVIIDGKGSKTDVTTYLAMAADLGKSSRSWPEDPFDAWRGGSAACVTKAAALLPQDGAEIYRQRVEASLHDIATAGTWSSTAELLQRLGNPADHITDPEALKALRAPQEYRIRAHESAHAQIRQALRGLDTTLDGANDPRGWAWDDDSTWDMAVVRVDSGNDQAAVRAASLMLTDLNCYREGRRTHNDKPLLVILDEASIVLDQPTAPDINALAEQLRSANIGLIVASQSVVGLGDNASRLLDSGATFLVGRLTSTDDLIHRIGTYRVPELAHQGLNSGLTATGVVAAREQEQFLLDPTRIRRLKPGQWAIATPGQPVFYFRGNVSL